MYFRSHISPFLQLPGPCARHRQSPALSHSRSASERCCERLRSRSLGTQLSPSVGSITCAGFTSQEQAELPQQGTCQPCWFAACSPGEPGALGLLRREQLQCRGGRRAAAFGNQGPAPAVAPDKPLWDPLPSAQIPGGGICFFARFLQCSQQSGMLTHK